MVRVSLECAVCETRRISQPDEEGTRSLRDRGACLLPCETCRSDTYWVLPSHERKSYRDTATSAAPASSTPQAVNRKPYNRVEHRVPLKLPVRVRVWALDGLEEVTTTTNVSRGGLYFETSVGFHMGQEVRVALNYAGKAAKEFEQTGHIVRVDSLAGNLRKGIAIKYDHPH